MSGNSQDFALSSVPNSARKGFLSIFAVMVGL